MVGNRLRRTGAVLTALSAALALAAVPLATNADATTSGVGQQMAIPAYINPGTPDGAGYWSDIDSAGSSLSFVIANSANGPGTRADANLSTAMGNATAAGVKVLGYVDTGYLGFPDVKGNRRATILGDTDPTSWLAQAELDINRWFAFYGSNVAGIFFDEGLNACGSSPGDRTYVDLYMQLNDYVKRYHPGSMTVINPGAPADSCYADAADVLVTFEGSYSTYLNPPADLAPQAWQLAYDPRKFWNVVYGVQDATQMQQVVAQSKANNVGFFYATDDVLPNPWDTLPSYLSSELSALPVTDTTSPVTPATPYTTDVTSTEIDLGWTSAAWNRVAGYDVYVNGAYAGSVANFTPADTRFAIRSLRPSTEYAITLRARDLAGTVSGSSVPLTVTTESSWGAPPSAPGSLTASGVDATSVHLGWTASTDTDQYVAYYDIYEDRNRILSLDGSTTSVHLGGMSPGTTHSFYVVARDNTDSVSAESNTVSVTTTNPAPIENPSVTLSTGDFQVKYNVPFNFHIVFIDSDQNPATGYRFYQVDGSDVVGADYMIEDGVFYSYAGTGQGWGWASVSGVAPLISSTDDLYHWRVDRSNFGSPSSVDVMFAGSGGSPDASTGKLTATL